MDKQINKTLRAGLLATSLSVATPLALADAIGVHLGAGQWQTEIDGSLGQDDTSINDLDFNQSNNNILYAALEHPIPLLPNIRVQYAKLEHQGSATLNTTFTLNNVTVPASVPFDTNIELTYTDAIAYYELLDNWVNLDLGLGIRYFEGYGETITGNARVDDASFEAVAPMLYADAQFDLPLTGLSIGANAQGFSYQDSEFTEFNVRVAYMFDSVADIGAELGYRQLNISQKDDLNIDVDFKGPYLALKFHF